MTWRERIQAARERGYFTEAEVHAASSSWLTCAVGECLDRYGTDVIQFRAHVPADAELLRLGSTIYHGFGWAVAAQRIDEAERLLDAIEDRALHLKRTHGETTV